MSRIDHHNNNNNNNNITNKLTYRQITLSKKLAYILRHGADKIGVEIRSDGYAKFSDILNTPSIKKQNFTQDEIESVVENNIKKRFTITKINDELYIRANQGHSLQVENLELKEVKGMEDLPKGSVVVHGTYFRYWESIKRCGLSKMFRNHIHFAIGEYGSTITISGMRESCEVLIYIDLDKAIQDGINFYLSENNVVLTSGIEGILSTKYFKYVLNTKKQTFDNDFSNRLEEKK